jgi:hypothetical protein
MHGEGSWIMVMEARHVETSSLAAPQPWTRIDLDLYEVILDTHICGYIEVVGHVFVALVGDRYDRAVEVGQTLGFAEAVDAIHRAA